MQHTCFANVPIKQHTFKSVDNFPSTHGLPGNFFKIKNHLLQFRSIIKLSVKLNNRKFQYQLVSTNLLLYWKDLIRIYKYFCGVVPSPHCKYKVCQTSIFQVLQDFVEATNHLPTYTMDTPVYNHSCYLHVTLFELRHIAFLSVKKSSRFSPSSLRYFEYIFAYDLTGLRLLSCLNTLYTSLGDIKFMWTAFLLQLFFDHLM